jgi:hypothetical protein
MRLTRQRLHAWLWSTPSDKVCEVLGISGGKLANICTRYRVPKPPRGHWRRIAVGHSIVPTRLPDPMDICLTDVELPDDVAAALFEPPLAQAEQDRVLPSMSHVSTEQKPAAIVSTGPMDGEELQPSDSMWARSIEPHGQTPKGGSKARLEVVPGVELLQQLAEDCHQYRQLLAALEQIQERACRENPATAAVMALWVQGASKILSQLDPVQKIVIACRTVADKAAQPDWWGDATGTTNSPPSA